jgi:hypothetical protein
VEKYSNVFKNKPTAPQKRLTTIEESKTTSKRKRIIEDDEEDSSYSCNNVNKGVKELKIENNTGVPRYVHTTFQTTNHKTVSTIEPVDKQFAKEFITKRKDKLLKTLKFKVVDNCGSVISNCEFNKVIDGAITPADLINEMLIKTKLNIPFEDIKLVHISKIGIFISLLPDYDDIKDLLILFHEKKIYLCFYVIGQGNLLNMAFKDDNGSRIIAQHVVKVVPEKFDIYSVFEDSKFIHPIITYEDVSNLTILKVHVYETLKKIQVFKYTGEHRDKSKEELLTQ